MRHLVSLLILLASIHLVASLYEERAPTYDGYSVSFPKLDANSKYMYWIQEDGKAKTSLALLYRKEAISQQSISISNQLPYTLSSVRFLVPDNTGLYVYVGIWKKRVETDTYGDLLLLKVNQNGAIVGTATVMANGSYKNSNQPVSVVVGDNDIVYVTSKSGSGYSVTVTAVLTTNMTVVKTTMLPYDSDKAVNSITTHFGNGVLYLIFQDNLVSMSSYPALTKLRSLKPVDISTSILDISVPSTPFLYAVDTAGNYLNKIDLNSMTKVKTASQDLSSDSIRWLALNPAEKQGFLFVFSYNTINIVRTSDLTVLESQRIGGTVPRDVRGFEVSRASNSPFLYLMTSSMIYKINRGCQPGTYATAGYCTRCKPGTYSTGYNQNSCTKCSPGYYQGYSGSTSCYACYQGSYTNQYEATVCMSCEPGTYSDVSGATSCTKCSPGKYNELYGNYYCSNCDYGKYAKSYGSKKCDDCWEGSITDFRGATTCTNCTAGSYSSSDKSYCSSCMPGSYSTEASSECTLCPAGTYTDKYSSTKCYACPDATIGQDYCGPSVTRYTFSPFFYTLVILAVGALTVTCCCCCLCLCGCCKGSSSKTKYVASPPAQGPRPQAQVQVARPVQYYQTQTYQAYQTVPHNQQAQQPVQYYQAPAAHETKQAPVYYQQQSYQQAQPTMYSNNVAQQEQVQYPFYQTQ